MSATRFEALGYLGYRALLAHPLKRLCQHGSGLARFEQNYQGEGLMPTQQEDRDIAEAASACIACGLCETKCPLAAAIPSVRDLGLQAVFRLYSKSSTEMHYAAAVLTNCSTCQGCEALCPTGVPIGRIVRYLLARIAALSRKVNQNSTHNAASMPLTP